MNKSLPDTYIREAICEAIDGVIIGTHTINCYDTIVSNHDMPDHYVLLSTQSSTIDRTNKCEDFWDSSIVLDVTTIYPRPGNVGSRELVDEIADYVRQQTADLQLDPSSGLKIITVTQTFPSDLFSKSKAENIFRKIIRLDLKIQ